MGLGEPIL